MREREIKNVISARQSAHEALAVEEMICGSLGWPASERAGVQKLQLLARIYADQACGMVTLPTITNLPLLLRHDGVKRPRVKRLNRVLNMSLEVCRLVTRCGQSLA
jgi:hypothetical protein